MKVRVKPEFISKGVSHRLDWNLMYIEIPSLGGFAVYKRDSGEITEFFPYNRNQHGWSRAKRLAYNASAPPHDPAINAAQDDVA